MMEKLQQERLEVSMKCQVNDTAFAGFTVMFERFLFSLEQVKFRVIAPGFKVL
jgi:hypothetical protein